MNYFGLRVDTSYLTSITHFKDTLTKHSSRFCYCYEGGETNPHMHFYIESRLSLKEFRRRTVTKHKLVKGNGGYAMKTLTEEPIQYISYMMKENNFHKHTITEDLYERSKEYQEQKKEAYKKKQKKDHLQEIIKIAEPYLENIDYYENQLKDIIIDYYKDNELNIQKYRLQTIFLTIYTRYSKNRDYLKTLIF